VADSAILGAILSILMKLFPNYVTTIVSWTEMLFGLGYMLGKLKRNHFYFILLLEIPSASNFISL
jgi:hypothetical protein